MVYFLPGTLKESPESRRALIIQTFAKSTMNCVGTIDLCRQPRSPAMAAISCDSGRLRVILCDSVDLYCIAAEVSG